MAWQKGHQGAYSTTSHGSARFSRRSRFSIPARVRNTTAGLSKMSGVPTNGRETGKTESPWKELSEL